jgi:hypothetical protein
MASLTTGWNFASCFKPFTIFSSDGTLALSCILAYSFALLKLKLASSLSNGKLTDSYSMSPRDNGSCSRSLSWFENRIVGQLMLLPAIESIHGGLGWADKTLEDKANPEMRYRISCDPAIHLQERACDRPVCVAFLGRIGFKVIPRPPRTSNPTTGCLQT